MVNPSVSTLWQPTELLTCGLGNAFCYAFYAKEFLKMFSFDDGAFFLLQNIKNSNKECN